MNLISKIKSFTLIELVVVIAVSTVVAGLAFSVIRLIQKNTSSIAIGYERKSSIQSLELSLYADFNNFRLVNWDEAKGELKFSSPINEKTYQFFKEDIRTSDQIFELKLLEKELYFKGEKVIQKEIDAIKLTFEVAKGQKLPVFIYKHNDLTTDFRYGN